MKNAKTIAILVFALMAVALTLMAATYTSIVSYGRIYSNVTFVTTSEPSPDCDISISATDMVDGKKSTYKMVVKGGVATAVVPLHIDRSCKWIGPFRVACSYNLPTESVSFSNCRGVFHPSIYVVNSGSHVHVTIYIED